MVDRDISQLGFQRSIGNFRRVASRYAVPSWDGRPLVPETSGWHWIEDSEGLRPLLWRGDDWPEPSDRGEWQDGYARLSARDLSRDRYFGPVAVSGEIGARLRELVLAGAM